MSNLNIGLIILRADRQWAHDHAAEPTEHERLNAISKAVEDHVGTAAVDELRLELANTRALLGKLVEAITEHWRPAAPLMSQVTEALRQVREVRRYLLSLQPRQKGAA